MDKVTKGKIYRVKRKPRIWPLKLANFTGQINKEKQEMPRKNGCQGRKARKT